MSARRWLVSFVAVLMVSNSVAAESSLGDVNACGPRMIRALLDEAVNEGDFKKLQFRLLDPKGAPVPTSISVIELLGAFQGVVITAPVEEGQFVALLDESDKLLSVKSVALGSELVQFDPLRQSRVSATFFCPVKKETATVTVTRNKKPTAISGTVRPESTAQIVSLNTSAPLLHKDKVKIEAEVAAGGGVAIVEGEIGLEAPKDIESATVYVGGKLEFAESSKPKVLLDLKYDGHKFPVGDSINWSHGPALLVDASSQDSDGEGKASIGYGFRHLGFSTTKGDDHIADTVDDRIILRRTDLTAAFEADDGLNTRNLIGDIQHQWQFAGSKWNFRPAVGIEGGTNLALKTKLEEFSNYNILRPTVDLYLARKFKKNVGVFKEISFSIDTQSRYLLEDEPDVEPLPKSEQTDDTKTKTVAADGFKFYGKAALTFGLTDNFSIVLDYEVGEQPPLYGDNNKGGVSIVYAF